MRLHKRNKCTVHMGYYNMSSANIILLNVLVMNQVEFTNTKNPTDFFKINNNSVFFSYIFIHHISAQLLLKVML